MKVIHKILRGLIVGILIIAVGIPAAMYLLLSSDWAQERLCSIANSELTNLLGTEVRVGKVHFDPFSRLKVCNVSILDDYGVEALKAEVLETRLELYDFIFRRETVVDYVVVEGLDCRLYRQTPDSKLNIADIIDRLKSEEKKDKTMFDLRINSVALLDCSVSYDVMSAPATDGRFNPSHMKIQDIEAEIHAPTISNDSYRLWLKYFSCKEMSGLEINDLTCRLDITDSDFRATDIKLQMPNSLLAFNEISCEINGIDQIASLGREIPVSISLTDDSHVWLPDLAPFWNRLDNVPSEIEMTLVAYGTLDTLQVERFRLVDAENNVDIGMHGVFASLNDIETAKVVESDANVLISNNRLSNFLYANHITLPDALQRYLESSPVTRLNAEFSGTLNNVEGEARLLSEAGSADVDVRAVKIGDNAGYNVRLHTVMDSLRLSEILPDSGLDALSATVDMNGRLGNRTFYGTVEAEIQNAVYKGYSYENISATITKDGNETTAILESEDPNLCFNANLRNSRRGAENFFHADCNIGAIRPDSLHLTDKYPGYKLSTRITASGRGTSADDFTGSLEMSNISFCRKTGDGIILDGITVEADNRGDFGHIWLESDVINGEVNGQIKPTMMKRDFMSIIDNVVPALVDSTFMNAPVPVVCNDFTYEFTVSDADSLCRFFKMPVEILDRATIEGRFSRRTREAGMEINIPWLHKGKDLIENTVVKIYLDGTNGAGNAYLTTYMPTIKGPMDLVADITGHYGRFSSNFDWSIHRAQPLHGIVDFDTDIYRDDTGRLLTEVDFKPGSITFGEDIWHINPSRILYSDSRIIVDDFSMTSINQIIRANGVAGKEVTDAMDVSFRSLNLINIFETLGIYNALIGGRADGNVHGTALLSSERNFDSNDIEVKDVSYNYCVLGDARGSMWFDNIRNSICFDADVTEPSLRHSSIAGFITPGSKELELNINADKVAVGFMKPFMAAFASGISGQASGYAKVYGTFDDVDLIGDIYADSLRIKLDFTNVWYNASDSLHIRPGRIDLDNIRLYDDYGNSALLNGYVGHTYFHYPVFDINITGARNMLVYDVPKSMSPIWYGQIFGDGSAKVIGVPNKVDIIANMETAKNSTFTFELTDFEDVSEYSFITFRDATPVEISDSIIQVNLVPEIVDRIRQMRLTGNNATATAYNIDLSVDINPFAKVSIVMDPVGGDRIDSRGNGHMRMTYGSADNDLRLYGKYTLTSGDYNFTLQDIIIKNFTINEGSSITFNGDPYSAQLDLQAYHTVNANLSDLDESFLTDKDLNRTNVPVRAMMYVKGDMRQPELEFDLEFPTLKSDVYRKVRSIVSTDEMMHKQIIYLLVLNRFFTPEYMSATRGNELFSVASSTLSGQLSSMLGKLSEHWSISPNLRSDKGDFSDIEVDVNLSSNLLDNRLLFNGNFGYRDKSLNTNQFVGDFDIEYLLTRSGIWRLKAYNRYNDQNFYLRTAQTTQGLGLVFRKDFDNIFNFLRRNRHEENDTIPTQINTEPNDTVANQP